VLGGETIDPGTRITLLLSAANRDPAMFEDPDAFRVNRENSKRHASFGLGVHFCLGAPLARAEGEEALRGLLGRFDSISLVEGDDVEYAPSYTLRDFVKVPVRLEESVA
jgi:cytochrome P450